MDCPDCEAKESLVEFGVETSYAKIALDGTRLLVKQPYTIRSAKYHLECLRCEQQVDYYKATGQWSMEIEYEKEA